MNDKISSSLDSIAEKLEAKGFKKEALKIDQATDAFETEKFAASVIEVEQKMSQAIDGAILNIKTALGELPMMGQTGDYAKTYHSLIDKYKMLFLEKLNQLDSTYK